jgi:hypothetical protein
LENGERSVISKISEADRQHLSQSSIILYPDGRRRGASAPAGDASAIMKTIGSDWLRLSRLAPCFVIPAYFFSSITSQPVMHDAGIFFFLVARAVILARGSTAGTSRGAGPTGGRP